MSKQTTTAHTGHQGDNHLTHLWRSRWKDYRTKYTYDALGRRASKTLNPGTLAATTRQYCYDGTCAIEERQNGAVAASFVHTSGLTEEIRENDAVVFEMRQGTQDYFVHTDDQGNVLALTGANGAVMERYDYDDYGAVTFLTPDGTPTSATSSAVGNPYCWGGLRLDAETGLQNDDGGVYFEPQTGRDVASFKPTAKIGALEFDVISKSAPPGNNPWSGGQAFNTKPKPKPEPKGHTNPLYDIKSM